MPFSSPRSPRLSRDAKRLLSLAQALAQSGSRVEDVYWEALIATHLNKLLLGRQNHTIEQVLDHLLEQDIQAYEVLAEQAETASESTTIVHQSQTYDVLLVAAPFLAWTRYQLPNGAINPAARDAIHTCIREHLMAPQAHVAILPDLVNVDQLPQSFQEVAVWTQRLGCQALGLPTEPCPLHQNGEVEHMLADGRFLIFALVAAKGEPLFRWQTTPDSIGPTRETCLQHWRERSQAALAPLFTGCQTEVLLPDAFYTSSRDADRKIRPLSIKAAVNWLEMVTQFSAADLHTTIVACGEERIEEFRVGFCAGSSSDVIYGCVWPVLSAADAVVDAMDGDKPDVPDEIAALLKSQGVQHVKRLPGLFPAEYCEDCGAPYFPNPLGEMQHPELPEETSTHPVYFH